MNQHSLLAADRAPALAAAGGAHASYRFFEFFTAKIANHARTGTTQLDDRRREETSLDEAERIGI